MRKDIKIWPVIYNPPNSERYIMTTLYKSYANNKKAFGNKSSNNVLLSLNLPREDIGLGNYLKDDFYTWIIIFLFQWEIPWSMTA